MLCDNADVVLDNPSATEVVSEAREEPRLNPPPPPPPVEPELGADDGFVLLGEDLGLPLGGDTPDNVRCMATFIIGPFPCLAGLPTASIRSLVLETAVVAVAVVGAPSVTSTGAPDMLVLVLATDALPSSVGPYVDAAAAAAATSSSLTAPLACCCWSEARLRSCNSRE